MYRHRLRPPSNAQLAVRGRTTLSGNAGNLFVKALGSGTLAARGRTTLAQTGWNIQSTAADPPVITGHPVSLPVTAPNGATFTVVATSTAPLSYQWQRNNGGGWSNINGATASSYTLSPTATSDTGAQFRCIVTNAYGSATSNAATLTVAAAGATFSISYTANEGSVAGRRHYRSEMLYEHAAATKDGTIIEAFDGSHSTSLNGDGTAMQNRVGEFDPANPGAGMVEVFPANSNASNLGGSFGTTGYDNIPYTYFDAVDSLVVMPNGQYKRDVADNSAGSRWVRSDETSLPPLGRPPLSTDQLGTNALFYAPTATLNAWRSRRGFYNTPTAYNKLLDIGMQIGGSKQPGGPMDLSEAAVSLMIPSRYVADNITAPYHIINYYPNPPRVGGALYLLFEGRASIVCLHQYVYWHGGMDETGVLRPYLFRADLSAVVKSATPLTTQLTVERLADAPFSTRAAAMTADPYSNTLLLFANQGVAMYDIEANSWQNITNNPALAEYVTAFATYGQGFGYCNFPHAAYIDHAGTQKRRRTYFFGGANGELKAGEPGFDICYSQVRSIAVTRTREISALNIQFEDPASPASLTHNSFEDGKHYSIVENFLPGYYDPQTSGGTRRLFLLGGDYAGWPQGQRSDYPTTPYWSYSGRQDGWYMDVSTSVSGGTARWKLAQNYYHNYPWNGSTGYFGAGRPGGGTEPQRGPLQPDAIGMFIDRRGQIWHGPSWSKYDQNFGTEIGGETAHNFAAMYKWDMPDTYPSTGIRLGGSGDGTKGWRRPAQNRLALFTVNDTAGTYDVGDPSESFGYARPNATAYDPVTDRAYVVGVSMNSTTLTCSVYSMSLDPNVVSGQGGQYLWQRNHQASISTRRLGLKNVSSVQSPNDDMHNGDIGSTLVIGDYLYFNWTASINVTSGGNVTSTFMRKAWLMRFRLSTQTLDYVPFPEQMNFWLSLWDGPLAAQGYAYDPNLYGTTGQYRNMKAVGTKIVVGPDFAHRVTRDPWICVYDTTTQTWSTWGAPADYAITNGGHDWPKTIFNLHAVPSLGEAWLIGNTSPGDDFGSVDDSFLATNGLHRRWWQMNVNAPGVQLGRRIIRFKVA